MADKHYLVLFDLVGGWPKGAVITAAAVAEGDVPRLVRLGAIRPATAEEIAAAPAPEKQ